MATVDLDQLYAETMLKFDHIFKAPGNQPSSRRQSVSQNDAAAEKQCEFCRTSYPGRRLIHHHIVPEDIVQRAGLLKDKTVELCFSCHRSLHNWNAQYVSWVYHEPEARRYRAKPLADVAEEYESAYMNFITHNFKKGHAATSTLQTSPEMAGSVT